MLATTALVLPAVAYADDKPAAAAAAAADASTTDATATDLSAEPEIVVIGRGETRQVQEIGQKDIAELAPGTSPLKAIEKLPSVNFQGADPFGAYEWAERISIRGFNQNQLGFTLDGIPLGDATYGNVNGLHISRAIGSENISRTEVSQGSGSIGTQATNNLGGTIEFFSRDPSQNVGLDTNFSAGSSNTVRVFTRLDSGDIMHSGARFWISYDYSQVGKWKGVGEQRQHQANFKGVVPVGDQFRVVGTFNYSDRRENDYQDMSLGMIARLGYNWDNISGDFPLAIQLADIGNNRGDTGAPVSNPAAGTAYPGVIRSIDDAYFNAAGLRRDYLASFGVETQGDSPVHGQLKGYYHSNHGQGLWWTPYVPSPSGVPISVRTTEYDIRRGGVFGDVGTKILFNDLTVGGWYESNAFRQARRFYGLDNRTASTRSSLVFQTNPFATQWDFNYLTETYQYYVQDKIELGALTIDLGWKGFQVNNKATPVVSGGLAAGKIKATDWFQPHAGAVYKLSGNAELFGDFSEVTRAYVGSATTGPFATTQAGFDALQAANNLKPETSDTWELGGRFRNRWLNALLAGYYVDFHNRLLAQTVGSGIQGNPAILQNVGSVQSYGIETALEIKLPAGFGLFGSYSYNHSTYSDDVAVPGTPPTIYPIAGKFVVDSPEHMAKGELTFDSRAFYARLGANYISKRYFTYTNDEEVPGRVLFDLTMGLRLHLPQGRKAEVQFNVVNLFDKSYIATLGSNGFGYSGDSQTLLPGSPQQWYLTLKTSF